MKCERCNEEHNGLFGSGRFCSRYCANSKVWTKEDNLKKSISAKNSEKVKKANKRLHKTLKKRTKTEIQEQIKKLKETWLNKLLTTDFKLLSPEQQRKRVIYEQNFTCINCELSKWLNIPIALEIEHIDGNHFNGDRKNLKALCPNCHSQTDTWRGRNKTSNIGKISDQQLYDMYIEKGNIHQTLIAVGLAPKGGNYKRVKKIIGMI